MYQLILNSDEYQNKYPNHPLSHLKDIFTIANNSYFTYRGGYRPLGLLVETVNICNNDCVICPYSSQTRKKGIMTSDMFKRVVEQYALIGGGPISLTPMVGEVFLDKKLKERLEVIKQIPTISKVSTITNATMASLYSDEELAEIIEKFDHITISVYGLDAEEFKIMTRKDRYGAFFEGLVRILKITPPDKISLGGRHLKKRTEIEIQNWLQRLADVAEISVDTISFSGTSTFANWSFFDTSEKLPFDAEWSPVPTNSRQCALPLISIQILSDGTISFCGCANYNGNSRVFTKG